MKKNKHLTSTLLTILWLLLPSMLLQSQSTQAFPLACNNCGTEITIVPSSQVICGEEVELEAQIGNEEVYNKIEWLQEGQTIAVGETAIRVGEAGTYTLKITFGDDCISRTSITLKNSEAYFKDNCFISIPIDSYTPIDGSGLNTTGSQSRSRMDDLEVTIGGMMLSMQGMTGGTALVSDDTNCEALANNISSYEEGEQTLTHVENNVLYLGSNQTGKSIIDDYLNYWQQRTREEGEEKDILSAPFEFNCGSEQFFASEVSDHWIDLLKDLFDCNEQGAVEPEGNGVVPKCLWECAIAIPGGPNMPFNSGVMDGAWEIIEAAGEGVADVATTYKNLLELQNDLLLYPFCKGLDKVEEVVKGVEQTESNPDFLERLRKGFANAVGDLNELACEESGEKLKAVKSSLEQIKRFFETISIAEIQSAWDQIKMAMTDYLKTISTCTNIKTCNKAQYEHGKLLFNFATLITGLGVEQGLLKAFQYVQKLLGKIPSTKLGGLFKFLDDAEDILPISARDKIANDPELFESWNKLRNLGCPIGFRGGITSRSNPDDCENLLKRIFGEPIDKKKVRALDYDATQDPDFYGLIADPNNEHLLKNWEKLSGLSKVNKSWVRRNVDLLQRMEDKNLTQHQEVDLLKFYNRSIRTPCIPEPPCNFETVLGNIPISKFGFPKFHPEFSLEGNKYFYDIDVQGNHSTDFTKATKWLEQQGVKIVEGTGSPITVELPNGSQKSITWHHHEDGKTLVPVFSDAHSTLSHAGGTSIVSKSLVGFFDSP